MNKRIMVGVVGCAVLALRTSAFAGGIAGSAHDFSDDLSWNTRAGVCSPCHAAHHTDEDQLAPLWIHATDKTTVFDTYDSPTMNATVGQPDGTSLACLSCHDGAVALNATVSNPNPATKYIIDASARIGENGHLHTTHPISFVYDSALAIADGGLEDPSYVIGAAKTADAAHKGMSAEGMVAPVPATWTGQAPPPGSTIDSWMLFDGKMQCSSCHDVHKLEGSAATSGIMARLSGNDANGRGSILCRTCHIK